jgi:WhiB family transcriptional regulator, redox-sensing transcriptional regulator
METSWMQEGKCRELPPETFFPSDGVGVEIARRICADCPVKGPCLEYALYNRIEHGVWGGASERERRRIARRRRSTGRLGGNPAAASPTSRVPASPTAAARPVELA